MKLQVQRIVCAPVFVRVILLAILGALPLTASAQVPNQPAPGELPAPPKTEPGPQGAPPSPRPPAMKPSEVPIADDLVGLGVFSSDGTRIGEVRSVNTGPSGNIVALHVRTGGFLGFGGRIVAIPQGKFMRSGPSIRLDLQADEVTGLPDAKE